MALEARAEGRESGGSGRAPWRGGNRGRGDAERARGEEREIEGIAGGGVRDERERPASEGSARVRSSWSRALRGKHGPAGEAEAHMA